MYILCNLIYLIIYNKTKLVKQNTMQTVNLCSTMQIIMAFIRLILNKMIYYSKKEICYDKTRFNC